MELFATAISALFALVSVAATGYNLYYSHIERIEHQAARISVWYEDDCVILSNESLQPVYEAIVTAVVSHKNTDPLNLSEAMRLQNEGAYGMHERGSEVTNSEYRRRISTIMPGVYSIEKPDADIRKVDPMLYEIAFRDAYGRVWVRLGNGKLKRRRSKDPTALYNVESIPKRYSLLSHHARIADTSSR